ncbi:hypothetical protein B7463_g11716, partial [Scytalidium lignicola]
MEEKKNVPSSQEIDFCTLGMFIIDEIHYLPPKPPVYDILGGAGSYAALGARIFSPPPQSRSISWIIDKGSDFPEDLLNQVNSWETSCVIRSTPDRLTTRGWNGYDSNENRAFKYATPKLRLDATSLTETLLRSKSFHLICNPTRCIDLVTSILQRRKAIDRNAEKPLFIWEPVPDLMTPDELLNTTNALPYVDICSPNHSELASLMGDLGEGIDKKTGSVDTAFVEGACEQLLGSMPLHSYALVIRCGGAGCYIAKNGGRTRRPSIIKRKRPAIHMRGGLTPDIDMVALFEGLMDGEGSFEREEPVIDRGIEMWLPPYHTNEKKVVDPTGGGNSFLGGMAVALARGKRLEEAAGWGNIAASFAIEQVGMPTLGVDKEGNETWNGVKVDDRLQEYREMVKNEK